MNKICKEDSQSKKKAKNKDIFSRSPQRAQQQTKTLI